MMIGNIFIKQLAVDPQGFLMTLFVVVFSVCFHEYCHAQAALWMGDSTAADRGHLTLNPMRQMGIFSIFMLLLLGFAWGAVPVNPANFRNRRTGALLTALAGPAANLILFLTACILFAVFARAGVETESLYRMLSCLGVMNCILLLFNLLPIPGLDGWTVFLCLFPKIRVPDTEAVKGIVVFLMLAALCCSHWLFGASFWLTIQTTNLLLSI